MRNKKLTIAIQSAIFTLAVGNVVAEPLTYSDMSSSITSQIESSYSTLATRALKDDDSKSSKDDDSKSSKDDDSKSSKDDDSESSKDDDSKSSKDDDSKSSKDDDSKSSKDDDSKSSKDDDSKSSKDDDSKSSKDDDSKSSKDDDSKSTMDDYGIEIDINIIYDFDEFGNPITDELGTPDTLDDDVNLIIDFSELDLESIAELSIDIIAGLTAEDFALISLDALAGLTSKQILALDISIWESLTSEQLAQLALSLTATDFMVLSQDVLNIAGFNLLMGFEINTVTNILTTVEESAAWDWMVSDDNVLAWVVLNHVEIIDADLNKFMPTGWNVAEGEVLKFELEENMVQNLSIDLLESMTIDSFALLDESVMDFFMVEQVEVIPTEILVEIDDSYLTKLTNSDKELSDDFLTKLIVNFDVEKLESRYKEKYDKEYAKELEKFYNRMLPKGWEIDIKVKDSDTSIKIKPPKQALKTDIFLQNLNPRFMSAIEFENTNDYDAVISSMFDYSEVISDDLINFAEVQPLANRINISFNLINRGNVAKIHQVVPLGWTFDSRTGYIDMTSDAVSQLTSDVIINLNAEQIVQFEPQVFSHFTVEQVTNLPTVAVKKLNRRQVANLSVESCAGFTKQHFANLDSDALSGMTIEHFNVVSPDALTGLTVANVGGLDSEVIYAMGLDILNNIESSATLSFADSLKIFSNLNVDLVQPVEIEKFLHQDIQIDVKTKKLKLKKGKLKLPKAKKVVLSAFIMPELPNLKVSLNLGGAFAEQTILTDLTKVLALPKINLPNFAFEQSETGIVKVKASGTNIELAFRAAAIEQLDVGIEPNLDVDDEGNYSLTTEEGQQVTFIPMFKDPELLAAIIPDGAIEISDTGEANIDLDSEDETADKLVGVFDPEVKTAESGLNIGINIEGTGVDQIAKIVYKDGTMQTMRPAVQDRSSVDIAGPIVAGDSNLKFSYHADGRVFYNLDGFKWLARPELKVTKVKVNLSQPIIKILKPGKLVELTTVKGFRQLIHIGKVD